LDVVAVDQAIAVHVQPRPALTVDRLPRRAALADILDVGNAVVVIAGVARSVARGATVLDLGSTFSAPLRCLARIESR
jgi:hypothetical protein